MMNSEMLKFWKRYDYVVRRLEEIEKRTERHWRQLGSRFTDLERRSRGIGAGA